MTQREVEGGSRIGGVRFGRRQCVVRVGGLSVRTSWRAVVVVGALLTGAVAIAVVAVGIGKYTVAPADVLGILTGERTPRSTGWWCWSGGRPGC